MILHIQTSILPSSEGIWISRLMRELPFPTWEQTNHWSPHCEGGNQVEFDAVMEAAKSMVICGCMTFYPWVQSPVNCLSSEERLHLPASPPLSGLPHPPPPSRSNFLPHLTTVTELLLLAVLKLSFAAEQRLLQPIDKNFIRRQALLCGVRGGEMF